MIRFAVVLIVLSLLVARPAAAAPDAAVLVAPTGDVVGTTLAFSWQSVPTSTWYLFWLGKGTPTAFIMQQWYTAEQAGCANGGTCTISLTPPINGGSHTWFIQTWAAGVTGPWSTGKVFTVKDPMPNWSSKLPNARRFTVVLDGEGVLDNETGVTWERAPSESTYSWDNAVYQCDRVEHALRRGWRLATLSELLSLVDTSQPTPTLPAGHPFTFGTQPSFWSQTYAPDATLRMGVAFLSTVPFPVVPGSTGTTARAWCVRSPAVTIY